MLQRGLTMKLESRPWIKQRNLPAIRLQESPREATAADQLLATEICSCHRVGKRMFTSSRPRKPECNSQVGGLNAGCLQWFQMTVVLFSYHRRWQCDFCISSLSYYKLLIPFAINRVARYLSRCLSLMQDVFCQTLILHLSEVTQTTFSQASAHTHTHTSHLGSPLVHAYTTITYEPASCSHFCDGGRIFIHKCPDNNMQLGSSYSAEATGILLPYSSCRQAPSSLRQVEELVQERHWQTLISH